MLLIHDGRDLAKCWECQSLLFERLCESFAGSADCLHGVSPLTGSDRSPIAKAHGHRRPIMDIHITLGNAILWVAGVYAAAVLFHHCYPPNEVFRWLRALVRSAAATPFPSESGELAPAESPGLMSHCPSRNGGSLRRLTGTSPLLVLPMV